ncbi:hypothetical protein TNCV_2289681 [Trichonephila clavipes]|uniref:Uncharacterized protein n=1 Tax=Trichonephila clavipes TaxID=2585209 RepID=A0A8X6V6B2_TRICX|nr:hypothetical protein TNCV_2289681 [Trichonephila clavipes]
MYPDQKGHQMSGTIGYAINYRGACRPEPWPLGTPRYVTAFIETGFKLRIHQTTALNCIKRLDFVSKLCLSATRIKRKKFNGQNFDMFLKSCSSQKGTDFGSFGDWR